MPAASGPGSRAAGLVGVETVRFEGADGLILAADVCGPATAQPVVLLHGGGQTRHAWRRALQDLGAAGWRAISLDARGHGDSAWPPDGNYNVDRFCADLRAELQTLGRPAVVVGASMGGNHALLAEGERPGLMRALVLVDVVPKLEPRGVQRIVDFMTSHPEGFASLDEAADVVAGYNPSRPKPRDAQGLAKNLRLGQDGRWRWHWDPRFMHLTPAQREARVALMREGMAQAAPRVKVPTLLVRGEHSDVVSDEGVAALHAQIAHLETANVTGAGHMVAGDRNDHFNAAIMDFLSRHAPP